MTGRTTIGRWHATAFAGWALALAMVTPGCGSGGSVPEGTLDIQNTCRRCAALVRVDLEEIRGPNYLSYDVWTCRGETLSIDLYPSAYDVTAHWDYGGIGTWFGVRVQEGCTTTLRVY